MSYQPATRTTNALAIVSLVFGILSWCMLPLVGALVAIVCGHLARGEIRRAPLGAQEGDALAVVGMVLGYVQLACMALATLFFVAALVFGLGLGAHFLNGH
ncbi:DUF4190 domain-containing protein [Dyella sp. ASV21]|uniref:DUF4190 domain-containing protein n=1 Tax=Dyella sp. ASV21 TaxID=2795114 RepID=UPI0018EDFB1F|nr:DUF4190 domain-containing protein [Dyella sp. ASV21]